MKAFQLLGAVEQLTAHLREEILRGRLSGTMPGVHQLAGNLGTSPKTVVEAARRLEHDGFLERQGAGRRSRIVIPEGQRPPGLRIELLLYEEADLGIGYMVELKHRLQEAGHVVNYSTKYVLDMDKETDLAKVAKYVRKSQAEAWLVVCGSLPLLKWFANQPVPTLAMYGRMREVPLAGVQPDKFPAMAVAVRRLVALGHRRIVMLAREQKLLPEPGLFERRFLESLETEGIRTGPYNLANWHGTPEGLGRCLNSLYKHTPPTAMLFDEPHLFTAARLHLAQCGISSPEHVSLISLDPDPFHAWCRPPVSHFFWDTVAMVRRIVQWANNMGCGKEDRRKTFFKTEFIEGGTIGPVPGVAARKY